LEVIGKKINYIRLHDFLDRIEVEQVYSSIHTFYTALTAGVGPDEEIEWEGHKYTKSTLLSTMREEEGLLNTIIITSHPSKTFEVDLKFASGNELVIKIKEQEQYAQILQFLADYSK
jgi:hypothetical protein